MDSTMEKEFVQLYGVMKKAAYFVATSSDKQAEEDRCLDAFKLLKKFPVTCEILVSARIGKHLRGLSGHPNKNIRSAAKELVEIWKAVVIKGAARYRKGKVCQKPSGKVVSVRSVTIQKVDRERPSIILKFKLVKETTVTEANTAKDEQKQVHAEIPKKDSSSSCTAPSNKKNVIKSTDPTREKLRKILQEAMSRVAGEANEAITDQVKACDPFTVSVALESTLFHEWGRFDGPHKLKYRSLIFNLKDKKNPDFRRRVLLGEFTPEKLSNMRTEDMASDERKKEIENIRMKALLKSEHQEKRRGTTDQFMCEKCGKRECTYYQMWTCSADEPMTTYVTCVLCNHH